MRLFVALMVVFACWGAQSGHALAASSMFQTPSENIGCIDGGRNLRCDINVKTWRSVPRPRWCHLAYGDSIALRGRGRPTWVCHGDTVRHMGRILRYGTTWRVGPFTCISRVTGLTCWNRNGHGFFLSIQSYRIF